MIQLLRSAAFAAASAAVLFAGHAASAHEANPNEPRMLFDGKTLNGWRPIGGEAEFKIEDGVIVGYAKPKTPSTYLSTTENFTDFILEAEMKVVGPMNSGIQFRTREIPAKEGTTVSGYQMEYDPEPRNWSGGIYGQSFGEWRYVTNDNLGCRKAFKLGEWNTYRIEAIGPEIVTLINGQPCSRYYGEEQKDGFISLQMHSVGGPGAEDMRGMWKNIRLWTENLDPLRTQLPDEMVEQNYMVNVLSPWERRVGYTILGDFSGSVEPASEGGFSPMAKASAVVAANPRQNFELNFEFRVDKGAAGAVRYLADANGEGGPEFRLADSQATIKQADVNTVGALTGVIKPINYLELPKRDVIRWKPAGEWNRARIVVDGMHVQHWLNHTLVVDYNRCSPQFAATLEAAGVADHAAFTRAGGHVAFADETGGVAFRNVKIRDLPGSGQDACLAE